MKAAIDTRNDAYHALENLAESRAAVLRVIREHGPLSDREIAERLGWEINRITGRRNELCDLRLIEADGKKLSRTGRRVTTWRIAEPTLTDVDACGQAALAL